MFYTSVFFWFELNLQSPIWNSVVEWKLSALTNFLLENHASSWTNSDSNEFCSCLTKITYYCAEARGDAQTPTSPRLSNCEKPLHHFDIASKFQNRISSLLVAFQGEQFTATSMRFSKLLEAREGNWLDSGWARDEFKLPHRYHPPVLFPARSLVQRTVYFVAAHKRAEGGWKVSHELHFQDKFDRRNRELSLLRSHYDKQMSVLEFAGISNVYHGCPPTAPLRWNHWLCAGCV